mgnify:CR=1 FL=1
MLEKEEIVSPNLEELKSHYHSIITLLGEDAGREGLLKTPERVAKAMLSLTKGYHMTLMKCCVRLSSRKNTARW